MYLMGVNILIILSKCNLFNVYSSYYSQKEMVCELDNRNLRVRSDSNSSL